MKTYYIYLLKPVKVINNGEMYRIYGTIMEDKEDSIILTSEDRTKTFQIYKSNIGLIEIEEKGDN